MQEHYSHDANEIKKRLIKQAVFNYVNRRKKKQYGNMECAFQFMLDQDVQRCGFVLGRIPCPNYIEGNTIGQSGCIVSRLQGLA